MRYVCSICGYVYDEEAEGTPFDDLTDTWTCPLCGAAKSAFDPEESPDTAAPAAVRASSATGAPSSGPSSTATTRDGDLTELPAGVLAAICSNLARGCEKQYLPEEAALYTELARWFGAHAPAPEAPADDREALDAVAMLMAGDLERRYPALQADAEAAGDRGTQRVRVWGEKVTRTLASLAERYRREGPGILAGTRIWVCSVCGFTYLGDRTPALCPVCKVPDWKFDEIGGRDA